jgi:ABC-2 type transport system ATP-binding protein
MGFRLQNVRVRYGRRIALDGVTLAFESGALGLLGPNGAGKSTLLRVVLGFVRADAGEVTVLGAPPDADATALRHRIGFAPEDDALLPGLSGVASTALCAELSGLPRHDALQRAHDMLHYVGLGEVRYRRVETYSQGMRQRLRLAQAIVHDPELVILDEPTNGLDPRGRQEMLELIADLVRKNVHLVLSSHLLPDVEAVCDQIAMLDSGRLVRAGRLADLLGRGQRDYEVRVKGDSAAFVARLGAAGANCEPLPQDLWRVALPQPGSTPLFVAAVAAGCQIRQIMPARTRLADVFATAVKGAGHDAGA